MVLDEFCATFLWLNCASLRSLNEPRNGLVRIAMSMTFQKRQKELKRQEKQRAKVERREQKKFAKRAV